MSIKTVLSFVLRYALIFVLFSVFFVAGSGAVAGKMPAGASEPGLVSDGVGLLIMVAVETLVLTALILTSRWGGWKLAILLSLAYYGAVTFLMQIETWYFFQISPSAPICYPLCSSCVFQSRLWSSRWLSGFWAKARLKPTINPIMPWSCPSANGSGSPRSLRRLTSHCIGAPGISSPGKTPNCEHFMDNQARPCLSGPIP